MVDAGNLLFSNPQIPKYRKDAAIMRADAILDAFSKIGCDAVNIGYGDLALGKDFLLERQKTTTFPFLCANLVDDKTGKMPFTPYVIKKVDGVRIGILGLISNKAKLRANLSDLRVIDPIDVAKRVVGELKNECHIIIALAQLGQGQDLKLAKEVTGINFIIGRYGRVSPLRRRDSKPFKTNGTIILQAHNRGRHLGRLEITIMNNSYQFVDYSEKVGILNEVATVADRIRHFGEELGSSSSDAKRIKKALKNLQKAQKQLEDIQGQSHYINTAVALDASIEEDPNIKTLISRYKSDLAKVRAKRFKKKMFPTWLPQADEGDTVEDQDEGMLDTDSEE